MSSIKMRMMLGDEDAAASNGFGTGETSDCCEVNNIASIEMNRSFFFMTAVYVYQVYSFRIYNCLDDNYSGNNT
jgi:hypothetical protein